jgi:hypothetical protein
LVLAVPRNSLERFFLCLPMLISHRQHCHVRARYPSRFKYGIHHRGDDCPPQHLPPSSSSILIELTLLSAGLLDLGCLSVADESVVWLELLHGLGGVVEEGEAGALAATELCAETEDGDLVLGGLVQLGELLAELILGHVGARWVEDVTVGGKRC